MKKLIKEIMVAIALATLLIAVVYTTTPKPAEAQINAISFDSELNKIDGKAVNGLLGTSNSLAYKVHEIEKHFHSRAHWLGKVASQTFTDAATSTLLPFVAISGNDVYGTDDVGGVEERDSVLVIGTADTPILSGYVKYDLHEILVTDVEHGTVYKMRIVYGSSTRAAAVTAGQ